MKIELRHKGKNFMADLSQPLDISIPIGQVKCFYAPDVEIKPYQNGDFTGSVKAGAPVNFFNVFFNPHGNGTHTECMGHISLDHQSVNEEIKQYHFIAKLVSIELEDKQGDQLVTLSRFKEIFSGSMPEALILRSLPNHLDKLRQDYSGTNPPYLEEKLVQYLVENGVKHLLLDLPSVDREEDGGELKAHKAFWNYPQTDRLDCTITELIYVPDEIEDGLYLLNLQFAPFDLDASPSKPVLYAMKPIT